MKLITVCMLLRVISAVFPTPDVTAITPGLNLKTSYIDKLGRRKDEEEEGVDESDERFIFIRIIEPLWIQSQDSASISIKSSCRFKWNYEGKPRKPPISLTITLVGKRGREDISYVLESNINPSITQYMWDIPNYQPSNNESEAISLKPDVGYRVYIHDTDLPYYTEKTHGRYHTAHVRFTFYVPGNVEQKFSSSFILQNSLLITTIFAIFSLSL